MSGLAHWVAIVYFGTQTAGSVPVILYITLLQFLTANSNVPGVHSMVTFGMAGRNDNLNAPSYRKRRFSSGDWETDQGRL
jgi:hypothetical protein